MNRYLKKGLYGDSGLTLVEILVVMLISAIVFTGMMFSYAEGVRYMRENSSMITLLNEGKTAMEMMGTKIRHAGRVRISSYGGSRNALLELDYLDDLGGGDIEFYFSRVKKQLKWNNRTHRQNRLNMTLLPMLNFDIGPNEDPYLMVKNLEFTPLDHIGPPSPYLKGYFLIKIEMVLEDDRGDTLYLSSIHSKRNSL